MNHRDRKQREPKEENNVNIITQQAATIWSVTYLIWILKDII